MGFAGPWMGSAGPWIGSSCLSMGFLVFLFDLPRRVSNRLKKGDIYRDLCSEVVGVARLGKSFLTASIKFIVVVIPIIHIFFLLQLTSTLEHSNYTYDILLYMKRYQVSKCHFYLVHLIHLLPTSSDLHHPPLWKPFMFFLGHKYNKYI